MMPSFNALLPLLWGKPDWQRHFADTVGEVRRSYAALGADVMIALVASVLLMGSGTDDLSGLLLQAISKLAGVACFLTLFATAAIRLGHDKGLCRVIAGLNWGLMLVSVLIQAVALIGVAVNVSTLVYGSVLMGFAWANAVLYRTIRQGLDAPGRLVFGAILLYWALSLVFSITALQIQFKGDMSVLPAAPGP